MLVYTGERLFVLRDPNLVHVAVPTDTWILLNSNVDFLSPPQEVMESNCFIVQAASSRTGRMAWANKIRGPYQFCLMRPWTLEELFAAYVCPSNDIQAFFNKFGGSARHVYQDSHDLLENQVNASAKLLDSKAIHRVVMNPCPIVVVDDRVGHMLITALPWDDKN
ncbi:hypothetical protein C8R44DRAFT_884653 [Mycena epipterygia]|nr:hypothetical protein C8R44DRAFT_884653 [Mycena epipterygia]